jgi:tetratricopeptide (TPR) repeat protein
MPDPLLNIFISYSHADNDFVDRLEADLRQQGFDTWVDRHGLVGGLRWRRELQEAVERAQVLLIVLSPEAITSQNVQIEYDYALDLGKLVIPVYYRQCNVPMELRTIQWIDFRHSYEQGIDALVQVLRMHQGKAASTASPAHSTPSAAGVLPSPQEASRTQPEPEAERPWNVPFPRNPFFTGRAQLLERLHELLGHTRSAAVNPSYALSGLGGIGKTQAAVEYAYRYRDEYAAVFWVRAASRDMLVSDYVALAQLLRLPGQDAQDQTFIVAAVKRWLEQHEGWLLILNNADELALLADFLPGEGKGHVLLTTRAQATGRIANSLPVEKLEMSEGMHFLLHRAKLLGPDEPLDNVSRTLRISAQKLVEELDGLPLALDQAAAYIEETECSLSEYLALYQSRRLYLLKRQSSVSADYPNSVASTWALSFQQVEQANPASAELLRLCAFLHPDAIPEAILTEGAGELGPMLEPVVADPLLLNEAIQVLRRYSLIKRDPEARLLNVHRLVQVVLKENLDEAAKREWAERTVRAVNRAFPEVSFDTWASCELCLPQAQVCAELIEEHRLSFPEAARLLHQAGVYLRERGHYKQAEPLLQQALRIREQVLGSEHPETASSLNDLAELYWHQGKYEQAEPLYQRALAIREQALGALHPETATTLNGLAALYAYQGKYEQAEPLLQRALSIREQALGVLHPMTASTLNNLAMLYTYKGKYEQAEPLYQRALSIREQALGPNNPDTALSLDNLAALYRYQGKYEQAEALHQRALTIYERVLGPEHPETAIALNNLAQLYQSQSQYERAQSLYQRALTIFERVLGPEHPRVAQSLHNLARLSAVQGHYEQAEPLYQRALRIREEALGPEHPDTTRVREDYTELLRTMQEKQAIPGQQEAGPEVQALLNAGEQVPQIAQSNSFQPMQQKQQGERG